jgi:hypothetical protein
LEENLFFVKDAVKESRTKTEIEIWEWSSTEKKNMLVDKSAVQVKSGAGAGLTKG